MGKHVKTRWPASGALSPFLAAVVLCALGVADATGAAQVLAVLRPSHPGTVLYWCGHKLEAPYTFTLANDRLHANGIPSSADTIGDAERFQSIYSGLRWVANRARRSGDWQGAARAFEYEVLRRSKAAVRNRSRLVSSVEKQRAIREALREICPETGGPAQLRGDSLYVPLPNRNIVLPYSLLSTDSEDSMRYALGRFDAVRASPKDFGGILNVVRTALAEKEPCLLFTNRASIERICGENQVRVAQNQIREAIETWRKERRVGEGGMVSASYLKRIADAAVRAQGGGR